MRILSSLFFAFIFSVSAAAHQMVTVREAFAVDTTPGMANAAAYVNLTNKGNTVATLTGASLSPESENLSNAVQLHTHVKEGDVMRMVEIAQPLVIQPGETLLMAPGGLHLMFLGLTEPLVAGTVIDIILHLEGDHTRDLTVQIPVISADEVPLSQMEPGDHGDHSTHNH